MTFLIVVVLAAGLVDALLGAWEAWQERRQLKGRVDKEVEESWERRIEGIRAERRRSED